MRKLLNSIRKNGIIAGLTILVAVLVAVNVLLPDGEEPVLPTDDANAVENTDVELNAGKVLISELMGKNHATLRDEDGDFSDWIELVNSTDETLDMTGWHISDKEGETGWTFPAMTLQAGERILVFASGKDRPETLHTDFSISQGETVYICDSNDNPVSQALCSAGDADVSLCLGEDGEYTQSLYPTPGYPNTAQGYDEWQSGQADAGALVINEIMTANFSTWYADGLGYCDWVEIKNISDEPVLLSDYCLSDDHENYVLWRFPELTLDPGKLIMVCCDDSLQSAADGIVRADFALDSSAEELYLSRADGTLVDYAPLRDIPYECSFGRVQGENGWFFFSEPTPGQDNGSGYRRVSAAPIALTEDGVFDGTAPISVELSGTGTIYYTTDSSLPTQSSAVYQGPISVDSTCVVRAVAVEEGAMESRPLTLSYIVGEGHTLPVLSLVSDDRSDFSGMYYNGVKGIELPGSLSLYEEDGSFTIPCGIKMHGETSLILAKKNMSVSFRGAYGQDALDYDIYGGGVTEFKDLVLRAGQDYYSAIIRNELCENLCLASTDNVVAQRSKYCVLYVNGEYFGIYALNEKVNEQLYASVAGVSRDSVTVVESEVPIDSELFQQVFYFCFTNDMSQAENYEQFCSVMDVDSLIDWIIMEGYCANGDLSYGNLRYCRSTENDGKWRLMFYDLDSSFLEKELNFTNLLSSYSLSVKQVSRLIDTLLDNGDFVDALLTRAGELLNSSLSNESVLQEIDRLAGQIRPEVERDYIRNGMSLDKWEWNIEYLKSFVSDGDWYQHNIDSLCELFDLTDEQQAHYFG